MAELDAQRTQVCITNALTAMEGYEVPLAHWRVHGTAFELYERMEDKKAAKSVVNSAAQRPRNWRIPCPPTSLFAAFFFPRPQSAGYLPTKRHPPNPPKRGNCCISRLIPPKKNTERARLSRFQKLLLQETQLIAVHDRATTQLSSQSQQ
jgi:hypothetical protein